MKNIMNSTKDISGLQDEINFNESCIKELPAMLNDEIERTKETYEQRIANTTNEIFIKKLTAMLNEQIEELKKLYEQREESYKEEIEKCNRAIKELKEENTMKRLDTFEDIMNELEAMGFEIEERTKMEEFPDDENGDAEVREITGDFTDVLNHIYFKIEIIKWHEMLLDNLEECARSILEIYFDEEQDEEVEYNFPADDDGHEAAEELYTEIMTKIKRYY